MKIKRGRGKYLYNDIIFFITIATFYVRHTKPNTFNRTNQNEGDKGDDEYFPNVHDVFT